MVVGLSKAVIKKCGRWIDNLLLKTISASLGRDGDGGGTTRGRERQLSTTDTTAVAGGGGRDLGHWTAQQPHYTGGDRC